MERADSMARQSTAAASAAKQAAAVQSQDATLYQAALPQLQADIESDNFDAAWHLAETTGNSGTTDKAATSNPLLEMLESSQGLTQLDPTKSWTAAEDQKYYAALQNYSTGAYNANLLGKNPYGNWGDASKSAQDAATDFSTDKGAAPDVQRFAGAKPTQSFLGKYGADLAALAVTVATAGVGAEVGAGLIAATGAESAAGIAAADIAGDAIVGAGIGATEGAITGGNIGKDALLGGVGGGIAGGVQASGLGSSVSGATGSSIAGKVASGLASSELTGLADSAITSPSSGAKSSSSSGAKPVASSTGAISGDSDSSEVGSTPGFLSGVQTGLGNSLGATAGSSLSNTLGTAVGTAAPYLAVGAIGLEQAKAGEANDAKYSQQQQSLAQPAIGESNTLLNNYQTGTISAADRATSNTEIAQGQQIVQSAQGLSNIAQTAFANYNSGTLNKADQTALDQQTAAQKQQVAQQLSSAGITDSTILAAQYQQIDNNALISKQNTLNGYFNTGNTAYNNWLSSTTQGQQTIQKGMEFASTSLNNELTQSMNEASIGIGEVNTAIQTQMTTDANYAAQVSTLMGTLATAYAKQVAGSAQTTINNNSGGAGSAARNGAAGTIGAAATSRLTGGSTGNTAGVSNASQSTFDSDTSLGSDIQNQTVGSTLGENSIESQTQTNIGQIADEDSSVWDDLAFG